MFKRTLCVLSCAAAMTTAMVGCAPLVVGSVAVATVSTVSTINDRRSAGSVVNDGVIEKRLSYEITQALKDQLGEEPEGRITVTAYDGKVLLTGEIETLKAKRIVTETVQKSLDVRSVVNELAVQPTISWTQRISDSKLATTVRSRMVMEDNVYLRQMGIRCQMKVVVERGIVYIMGIVTPQENTIAMTVAARTSGVVRVISVCDVMSAERIKARLKNINQENKAAQQQTEEEVPSGS